MATWYGILLVVVICLIVIGVIVLLCFRQCFRCKRSSDDDIIGSEEGRRGPLVFSIPMTVDSKRPSNISFGPPARTSIDSTGK